MGCNRQGCVEIRLAQFDQWQVYCQFRMQHLRTKPNLPAVYPTYVRYKLGEDESGAQTMYLNPQIRAKG